MAYGSGKARVFRTQGEKKVKSTQTPASWCCTHKAKNITAGDSRYFPNCWLALTSSGRDTTHLMNYNWFHKSSRLILRPSLAPIESRSKPTANHYSYLSATTG
jgi:hypothetical protein